jgi:hypothetical protein
MRNFNYTHDFYEYKTWSNTLREKYRLRVFYSRRVFGPKRGEVRGGWINYLMGKFFTVYYGGGIKSRKTKYAGHVARMGGKRNTHSI